MAKNYNPKEFEERIYKNWEEHGRENVVNGTVGALLDDDGQLAILSLVVDIFKHLAPRDFEHRNE